jgi:3-hydroxyisobutyrate dehydrogenase-like beta-hydroxyacid dehydrogenase
MNKPNVGVIGLGSMDGGVATSLLRAGFTVGVYDVRGDVVQSFVSIVVPSLVQVLPTLALRVKSSSCWS